MNYRTAVAQGKKLLQQAEGSLWELAKLSHIVVVEDGRPAREWANDLGLSISTVRGYVNVWKLYGTSRLSTRRGERSFNEHLELAKRSETAARELLAEAERRGENIQTMASQLREEARLAAQRAELFEKREEPELDVEGVRTMLEDPTIGAEAKKVARQREQELLEYRRRKDEVRESTKGVRGAAAAIVLHPLVGAMETFREDIHMLVEEDAPIGSRDWNRIVALLREIVEDVEVYASRHDIEAGLAELLTR